MKRQTLSKLAKGVNRVVLPPSLLWAAIKKFDGDHGLFLASGVTFSLVICLFPLLLLLLAILGTYLYSTREVLQHIRLYLENVAPTLDPRVMRSVMRIIRDRKIVGILGMGGLIWASTWVFSSLRTALNVIFQVEKGRGVLHGKAIDLLMLLAAGVLLGASMALTSVVNYVQAFGLGTAVDLGPLLRFLLKYLVPFLSTLCMFFVIFLVVPNRKIRSGAAFQAACFTGVMWEAAKQCFGWYVMHLGRFSMVYGSLSALAIFLLWVYYSSAILVLGGEVAFLLETGKRGNHEA